MSDEGWGDEGTYLSFPTPGPLALVPGSEG